MEQQSPTKTILISGASRGLGKALAENFAQKGWQLIINARGNDQLQAVARDLSQHTKVIAIAGDIADPAHRKALATAAAEAGGIDVLINNAGILGPSPLPALLDLSLKKLENIFRVNTIAQLGLIQALRNTLKSGAIIINISSDAARVAYQGWGGYGASKAALEMLSAVLAEENPQWRIYAVDPGDMRTRMHQEAFPGEDISDRPEPESSVPGILQLLQGNFTSGRYRISELGMKVF